MLKGIHKYLLMCFGTVLFTVQANAARIMSNNPIKEDWQCKVVDGEWSCKRAKKPKSVFDKKLTKTEKEKALADDLAWVKKPSFVGGYYSNDNQFTKALCESKKTDLSYEKSEFDNYGTLIASGNVQVLQCDQELYGNNAIINLNSNNSAIRSLVMAGDVIVKQPSTGIVIRTTELDADMNNGTYSTGEAYFRLAREMPKTRIYDKEHFSGYLRGYAKTFKKESSGDIVLSDGYITSGDPYDNAWKITGNNIDIDTNTHMAYVKNGYFEIQDIPAMYIPYFSHPIDDRRRSGFLYPGFVQNANSGIGISVPYYFNLAPNYDLMLQSVIWSQRGIVENGTFRYMTKYFQGQFEGSLVPYDFKEGKMRGSFALSTTGQYENINTNFKYEYVSDQNYYNDFSAGNVNLVTKTLLDREFDLTYTNDYVDSGLTVLDYGVVNPLLTVDNTPYAKLPEVKLNLTSDGYTPDYLTLSAQTLNTFFYKTAGPANTNPGAPQGTNVNAFRAYESPKIAFNFNKTWGYLNPSLEVPIRYYQLKNSPTDTIQFANSSVTSVLPIFNIDAGAYFDKDYTNENGTYTSTLHPRLFYTYIPYQDQTNIPLFDTSLQNEQYMQMFQVNRFTGYDRINNANQLTYAIEASTTNQDNGITLASAKIGQMAYFADRKVNLCQGNSACPNPGLMDPFSTDTFSPIMSSFEFRVMKNIYLSAQVNYRVKQQNVDYQVYQLSYKDENENIFNVSYNNIANNWNSLTQQQIVEGAKPQPQETITLSTVLNITDHWGIAALWNYNFQQKQIANIFAGLQYNAKSWAVRALWQKTAYTNQDPNNPTLLGPLVNTYMFEFELKGLGGIGNTSDISSRLQQINGYQVGEWGNGI
ncbi:LPS assembly protein LptD [Francisella tularensis subsp. mediasiatica]|nr:LPS assembly protein LptD [Francisella tularensis subsp. mediasiatica]WKL79333.1 LPS assembly protein LptD [Francisella tularensis subsp. mediasiatica]WKL81057.1 LPS assembly protein LptD [Francisella tularensis subsp. mediasiatica]